MIEFRSDAVFRRVETVVQNLASKFPRFNMKLVVRKINDAGSLFLFKNIGFYLKFWYFFRKLFFVIHFKGRKRS